MALSVNWFSDGKPNDKTAFPLLATSLADFPPTIIGAAEYDILRDQAIQFATRLWNESRAGCEIHVRNYAPNSFKIYIIIKYMDKLLGVERNNSCRGLARTTGSNTSRSA